MMILGRKLGMSHVFDENGHMKPVSVVACDDNFVIGHKTLATDAYQATVIATRGSKHLTKSLQVLLNKLKITDRPSIIREFRSTDEIQSKLALGSRIDLNEFKPGDIIKITATSKGKGFAGTIKRHGFSRGPKTHGSHNYRQPGSIGAQQPQRVIKGKKMAGHLGNARTTVDRLTIYQVDIDRQIIVLGGSVPGPNRALVMIQKI